MHHANHVLLHTYTERKDRRYTVYNEHIIQVKLHTHTRKCMHKFKRERLPIKRESSWQHDILENDIYRLQYIHIHFTHTYIVHSHTHLLAVSHNDAHHRTEI